MLAANKNTGRSNYSAGTRKRFNSNPGKRIFKIPHQYGTDEVQIDLLSTEQGWNFIGSFQLDAGPNKVEQTDKNDTLYVMADAIKWVKR